ncbi:MAG: glycoside hydrolase family 2 protein, partial [Methanococcaceae archaeon]
MPSVIRFKNVYSAILLTILMFGLSSCSTNFFSRKSGDGLYLLTPGDGSTVTNNITPLAWNGIQCKKYEVYLDDIKIDTVSSRLNSYVPFPLSFGKHYWYVKALNDSNSIKSETGEFTVEDHPLKNLPENALLLRDNWRMNSSYNITAEGREISGPMTYDGSWSKATLPATVLSVLVRNGVYPNPVIGINNMYIPDCSDKFNEKYDLLKYSHIPNKNPWLKPYWFRREFNLPGNYSGKSRIMLNFDEINYKAEVWLNGKQLADTASMVGMEREFRFDITDVVNREKKNYLAVLIYPLDHPGEPAPEPVEALSDPGRNMGQDGMMAKDYSKWDAMGWDWQPPIRDRDMGITEDVYISATDKIELTNLYITSDMELPDTTKADITISADVVNYSDKAKSGEVNIILSKAGDKITNINSCIDIGPGETKKILFDKSQFSQLVLHNPKLWWPKGYGSPELYDLKLKIEDTEGEESENETSFGIRKLETFIGNKERIYKINGKQIYPIAGNWVIDNMLSWNAKRYEHEVRLALNAGFNLLRIWGPTGVPPEVFFDAADKQGLLLWQDFLNDFWGTEHNDPNLRPDEKLFRLATTDIVKKLRNHPSLIIWCGGNEGVNPREALIRTTILPEFDGRDSKQYLSASDGDGLHGGGPYHTLTPRAYFSHPKLSGFSSEIGPSGIPVFESMVRFLPKLGLQWTEGHFPHNGEWAYHDATDRPDDFRKYSYYDSIITSSYGFPKPSGLEGIIEYASKSQLVNYDVYRASVESINRLLWDKASGIGLWKTNSSWPSLIWQVYDWYMQANSGFYGLKNASGKFHIQLDRDNMKLSLINTSFKKYTHLKVRAELYSRELKSLWDFNRDAIIEENSVVNTDWTVPTTDSLSFLKLSVFNDKDILAENFYWLNKNDDYKEISQLSEACLKVQADESSRGNQKNYEV